MSENADESRFELTLRSEGDRRSRRWPAAADPAFARLRAAPAGRVRCSPRTSRAWSAASASNRSKPCSSCASHVDPAAAFGACRPATGPSRSRSAPARAPKLANDRSPSRRPAGSPPAYAAAREISSWCCSNMPTSRRWSGLLTDGLTVKSNDVFIPSEPAVRLEQPHRQQLYSADGDPGAGRERRAARPVGRRVDRRSIAVSMPSG